MLVIHVSRGFVLRLHVVIVFLAGDAAELAAVVPPEAAVVHFADFAGGVTFAPEMEASIKWVMQLDGDEYAEEFGVSSAKGKTVLAFWLNHSPEVNRYYMASFNMGIEQYFENEDFDTEVCWTVYNYTYPYTQLPMIMVVPQGSLRVGYYIGFPTNDEETKLGKPFVQKIDPKDLSVSSVSDFKSRVAAESATTRTAAPWDATPKELKRLDFPQLQR